MWLLLSVVTLSSLAKAATSQILYPFSFYANKEATLDEEGKFRLSWKEEGHASIVFEVVAETSGWVGLGLSPNGGMKDSDFVVGGVQDDGSPYLIDCHGVGNVQPMRDSSQDVTLLNAAENATHTRLQFRRKLRTCDPDDRPITADTIRILWATGSVDVSEADSGSPEFIQHHAHSRGARSIILIGNTFVPPPLPDSAFPIDFRHHNVSIPDDYHTHYWCQVFNVPHKKEKHHMVKFEVMFSEETKPYVHHILLYHCIGNMSEEAGHSEQCFDRSQSEFSAMYSCASRLVAGWAVGGEDQTLPEGLGFPIFEAGSSPFFMLEVHYDNKYKHKGKVDHSGLRVWVTPEVRAVDVGSLSLGMGIAPKSMLIPPNQKRFVLYSFCDHMCTKNFPANGIKILSIFPHAHYIGVGMVLRHIRNGTELAPLMVDNSYDFNYQDSRKFWPPKLVRQNDTLLLECHYDSSARDGATFGGYATRDEMCFAFISFFPRFPDSMTLCIAGPLEEVYAKGMRARREPIQGASSGRFGAMVYGKYGANITLMNYATRYNWSDATLPSAKTLSRSTRRTSWKGELFQRLVRRESYFETCGHIAPDGAQGVDLAVADHEGLIEHMQWEIEGGKALPLPHAPYRVTDECGLGMDHSEDWELDDPIPEAIERDLKEEEVGLKMLRSDADRGRISLVVFLITAVVMILK